MRRILVTGGAGFVGANIAAGLKHSFDGCEIVCLDNLYRKGSELNVPRLESNGIRFIRGTSGTWTTSARPAKLTF